MNYFERIVGQLKINLQKDLPGFQAQQRMAPSFRGGPGFPQSPDNNTRGSAVLIAIYPDDDRAKTILIKRTVYNGAHSGQVSFPGGKQEDFDKSLIVTAIREAEEEVGIDANQVGVIGALTPLFIPVSNLMVLPVVCEIPKPTNLHLNLQEVEYTIHVDLMNFKDPEKLSVKTICVGNNPISAPYYAVEGEVVWGATAMIISELTDLY
jgi:8-oxo-dGTP pyrophosphatase MutT (NUDIX family)